MITFNNLSLYYACERWINLQARYIDTQDVSILREMRRVELRIRQIVNEIKNELMEERHRVDPLSPMSNP